MTKEEQFVNELIGYIFAYPDDDYMTMECLCRKLVKHGLLDKAEGYYQTHEIRTNTHECVKDTHDKTDPSNSEIPNNCKAKNYCDDCLYTDTCDSKEFFYACTSKATISKMEQVDEPQTSGVMWTEDAIKDEPKSYSTWASTDEPQTDCAWR